MSVTIDVPVIAMSISAKLPIRSYVFNPPVAPSVNSGGDEINCRTLEAEFGDGYSQRAGDGLNAVSTDVSLMFEGLTESQKNEIDEFLRERAGYKPFEYTMPDEDSSRKYTCKKWTVTRPQGVLYSMNVPLKQVFDI